MHINGLWGRGEGGRLKEVWGGERRDRTEEVEGKQFFVTQIWEGRHVSASGGGVVASDQAGGRLLLPSSQQC